MGVKVTPPWRNPVSTDSMISYYLLFRVGDLCELFRFFFLCPLGDSETWNPEPCVRGASGVPEPPGLALVFSRQGLHSAQAT